MKRLLSLSLAVWASAANADPSLVGQWISDREASAAFNEGQVQLQAKTAEFHRDSMGRLVVTFSAENVSYALPNFTTTIEGKKFPITGFAESHPYTVVATTPNSIAIRTLAPVSHEPVIVVYNFEGSDTMWIYVSTLGRHLREYFKRMKTE